MYRGDGAVEMRCSAEEITGTKKRKGGSEFMIHVRNVTETAVKVNVPFGVMEREGRITSSYQAVAERDGQIASLNRTLVELEDQVDAYHQTVLGRDEQITSFKQTVA